ncbi:nuclear transport factor 2 family protein [Nocardia salmonicida]|uniref:nuclear transport factor 2 family protein n=1 Tax=Nocardia salmonicida TaxID=53431 RepID=UPI0009ECFFFE|nr:nuclear transport factor 2 family protein [Nocardia salmonicida]
MSLSLNESKDRNVELVRQWCDAYNSGGAKMVDDFYSDDCTVEVPGVLEKCSRSLLRSIESDVDDKNPQRRIQLTRVVPDGDAVIVLGFYRQNGEGARNEKFMALLRFDSEGKVCEDISFLDFRFAERLWKGMEARASGSDDEH